MKIPPSYTVTSEMHDFLRQIEAHRSALSLHTISVQIQEKIRHKSVLKSSLFSARIEGNPLTERDLINSDDQRSKREIFNIMEAVKYLDKNKSQSILPERIGMIHAHVMKGLRVDAGSFRSEVTTIFNQAGVAVYMPPPPQEVSSLTEDLCAYIVSDDEKSPLIKAMMTHLIFEKIHPFVDGNGRVGRLLIYAVLCREKYDFGLYVPFEEYLDDHKELYYYHLDHGMRETEEYLLFVLEAFLEQCKRAVDMTEMMVKGAEVLSLSPRQEEIYLIIKEHGTVSFDFMRRRFLKIPPRTLRYDLKKLVDKKHVEKIGRTKGAWYKMRGV